MVNSDVDGSLTAEIELDLEPDAFVKLGGVTITSTKLIPSPSVLESCIATPTTRQAGGGDVQQGALIVITAPPQVHHQAVEHVALPRHGDRGGA